MSKSWLYVVLAGIVEVLWVIGLKYSVSWSEWTATAVLIGLSFYLIILSTQTLPVATAYAVFTGMGTAGTAIVGILVFGEEFSWMKILFLVLLVIGILGLKLVTNEEKDVA